MKWIGRSINAYVDCHSDHLKSEELARYPVEVGQKGERKGSVFVDLKHRAPSHAPSAELTVEARHSTVCRHDPSRPDTTGNGSVRACLQRCPGEEEALLADVAEAHDRLGLIAAALDVEDHAFTEDLVRDVVADLEPE